MTPPPIPELAAAARTVLTVLDEAGIPACVIGALAVHRWGQPRATSDADFSALASYGDEGPVIDALLDRFAPRRPSVRPLESRLAVEDVRRCRVDIDVALAAFPFEIEAIETASSWEIVPGLFLRACSAEHLIVYKLIAARGRSR